MSVESMISEGFYLMLIGMTFVVCFLTVLVLILNLMAKFIPMDPIEIKKPLQAAQDHSALTAVISAAVHQHRNTQ